MSDAFKLVSADNMWMQVECGSIEAESFVQSVVEQTPIASIAAVPTDTTDTDTDTADSDS